MRLNDQSVGDVYIISAILDHPTDSSFSFHPEIDRLCLHRDSFGCQKGENRYPDTGQQQFGCARRRQCCTGTGGVPTPQLFLSAADIIFQGHSVLLTEDPEGAGNKVPVRLTQRPTPA